MEDLLVIALVGGLIVFFAIWRPRHRGPRKSNYQHAPRRNKPKAQRQYSEPFSADTASPAEHRTILSGKAYVVDGDTIVIQKVQIRLFGVDAPEMNHPYGKKAKWALFEMVKGRNVDAEILETDAHGRTVARCTLPDGSDLSKEMVAAGLALDWPKYSGGVYKRFETTDARKKLWLADARQKGRMHVWEAYDARSRGAAGR